MIHGLHSSRSHLLPWGRSHAQDSKDVRSTAQIDVFGKHAGNVKTSSENISDNVDGQLRDNENDPKEKRCRSASRAILILDCHEQCAWIPKRSAMPVFCCFVRVEQQWAVFDLRS